LISGYEVFCGDAENDTRDGCAPNGLTGYDWVGLRARGKVVHFMQGVFAFRFVGVFFDDPFADVLVFHPILEVGDDFLLGFLALFLDLRFGEVLFGGAEVVAAEFSDDPAQTAEGAELVGEFSGDGAVPVREELGAAGGQHRGQVFGEPAGDGLFELPGVFGETLGVGEEIALEFPVGETAETPFAEVLFAEGDAVELLVEGGGRFCRCGWWS